MTLFKKCHSCGASVPEEHRGACPKCGEQKGYLITREINETITITDTVVASIGLHFELTDPVSIPNIKRSSNEIELIFDSNDRSRLNAFRIKVSNFDPQEIVNAFQKAYRLTNFISWKYGAYVFHKRPRKVVNGQLSDTVSFTTDTVLSALIDMDLDNQDLYHLITTNSKDNQRLAHFTNGQRALEDANFSEAIREFYQVIETEIEREERNPNTHPEVTHLKNYKHLRHGVSHVELHNPTTTNILKSTFHLTLVINPNTNQEYLDPSNPSNEDILEKEANYIRREVIKFLNNKINI